MRSLTNLLAITFLAAVTIFGAEPNTLADAEKKEGWQRQRFFRLAILLRNNSPERLDHHQRLHHRNRA